MKIQLDYDHFSREFQRSIDAADEKDIKVCMDICVENYSIQRAEASTSIPNDFVEGWEGDFVDGTPIDCGDLSQCGVEFICKSILEYDEEKRNEII